MDGMIPLNEMGSDGWNGVPYFHVPVSDFIPDLRDFYLHPRIVKMLLAQVVCVWAKTDDI